MNERIRELADQVLPNEKEFHKGDPKDWGYFFSSDELEKFAQLIALKCAQLAMTQHTSTSPDDYGDMEPYDQGCDDTASTISGMIRRTFGVEE